jgi:hypothetical protein
MAESIAAEGGEYFGFLVIGMIVYLFLANAVNALPGAIRGGIGSGTLEAMFTTPTTLPDAAQRDGRLRVRSGSGFAQLVMLTRAWVLGMGVEWTKLAVAVGILMLIVLAYLPVRAVRRSADPGGAHHRTAAHARARRFRAARRDLLPDPRDPLVDRRHLGLDPAHIRAPRAAPHPARRDAASGRCWAISRSSPRSPRFSCSQAASVSSPRSATPAARAPWPTTDPASPRLPQVQTQTVPATTPQAVGTLPTAFSGSGYTSTPLVLVTPPPPPQRRAEQEHDGGFQGARRCVEPRGGERLELDQR